MKINELVKFDRVLLNYGEQDGDLVSCGGFAQWLYIKDRSSFKPWEAEVKAKPRGKDATVVFLLVKGFYEDLGDVYAHQIMAVWNKQGNGWTAIDHTDKQIKMRDMVAAMRM